MDKDSIKRLIDANRLDEAEAGVLYLLGRIAWKRGRKGEAISLYERAVALDADSEAAVALQQAREIMDFFNKDLLNP